MMKSANSGKGADRRGTAAIEFALVGPMFILLLVGMIVYGGWFWMAHSVQAAVSEGARAAVAGLDPLEREQLARSVVATQLGDLGLRPTDAVVTVRGQAGTFRIEVAYDARRHPLMALSPLTIAPPETIRRSAIIRVGEG
ncbi:TadE/TadG family type IV pilus assembly protein [Brevundimonas diminuta]|uniref:TadE/TadG family type IV pilus assembly protein n=1 Tax=Brevundimonas diminuta TaxID=293 RepID=UPI003D083F2E